MLDTGCLALSIFWSTALLTWLAHVDPKRRRTQQQTAAAPSAKKTKNLATWLLFVPALVFLASGDWPSLLMWLGSILCIGWTISLIYAQTK